MLGAILLYNIECIYNTNTVHKYEKLMWKLNHIQKFCLIGIGHWVRLIFVHRKSLLCARVINRYTIE